MTEAEKNSKTIRISCWIFIGIGLAEIFDLIFSTGNFYFVIPGLITVFSAYYTLHISKSKRNYFVSIWAFAKYNPISLMIIAMLMQSSFGSVMSDNIGKPMMPIIFIAFLILSPISLVFGILLMIKISIHNKYLKINPG
jgi:hypothetical protein